MEKREDGRYVFPEGKYVMIKMPNRPLLSVYQVPNDTSFSQSHLHFLTSPPQVPDNAFEEEEGGDADLGGDDDEGLD
jgi:hypothetical protein